MAGIHLLDKETGEYNIPFIQRVLPGREMAVINLAYRTQGLMFVAGNPKEIKCLADLCRPDVTFVNRQKGSGTRVLLDIQFKREGIDSHRIRGYTAELDTHLAIASSVARGKADSGLGIEAAARSCGLGFLPLFRERFDLVIPGPVYKSNKLSLLLRIMSSAEFKKIVGAVEGYDVSQTGTLTFVT